jgi:hypothetical protein
LFVKVPEMVTIAPCWYDALFAVAVRFQPAAEAAGTAIPKINVKSSIAQSAVVRFRLFFSVNMIWGDMVCYIVSWC